MRIGVLCNRDSWYFRDLQRAAGDRHELLPLSFVTLSADICGAGLSARCGVEFLSEFDALLVRTMPPGSLEQVVFRMDVLGRIAAAGTLVVNSARAVETAVDKFLASARLQEAGLPTPRTCVCQGVDEAMEAFVGLGGDVVVKPLFGSEGRGITRVSDEALALRAFTLLSRMGAVIYLQEFIPHAGADLRLLVIGRRVLGMQRINPADWRTNVSRGASTEPLDIDDRLTEMAHRAADSVGARIAGVDLLPAQDGTMYALEVNAVPGWKALAETLHVDVAATVLAYLEEIADRRTNSNADCPTPE